MTNILVEIQICYLLAVWPTLNSVLDFSKSQVSPLENDHRNSNPKVSFRKKK